MSNLALNDYSRFVHDAMETDIESAIKEKMEKNAERPYMHGKRA